MSIPLQRREKKSKNKDSNVCFVDFFSKHGCIRAENVLNHVQAVMLLFFANGSEESQLCNNKA